MILCFTSVGKVFAILVAKMVILLQKPFNIKKNAIIETYF